MDQFPPRGGIWGHEYTAICVKGDRKFLYSNQGSFSRLQDTWDLAGIDAFQQYGGFKANAFAFLGSPKTFEGRERQCRFKNDNNIPSTVFSM